MPCFISLPKVSALIVCVQFRRPIDKGCVPLRDPPVALVESDSRNDRMHVFRSSVSQP